MAVFLFICLGKNADVLKQGVANERKRYICKVTKLLKYSETCL